jgi:ribosomal protein S18 acetylase RimI-like enzyme
MVRPMKPEDREIVFDIIRATKMFTPDEISVARELVDIYLDKPDQRDYFLAVVENGSGAVAGYLAYGPTPLTDGTYDLYWMAVAPDQQGFGFGKELVRWLEKKVAEEGGRIVLIETSSQPKYDPTRRFYSGLGYKEISRIPDFYRRGDDRITYIKKMV